MIDLTFMPVLITLASFTAPPWEERSDFVWACLDSDLNRQHLAKPSAFIGVSSDHPAIPLLDHALRAPETVAVRQLCSCFEYAYSGVRGIVPFEDYYWRYELMQENRMDEANALMEPNWSLPEPELDLLERDLEQRGADLVACVRSETERVALVTRISPLNTFIAGRLGWMR